MLSAAASAQESGSDTFTFSFSDNFAFLLRVAEAPCPTGIDFIPEEAVCYRHGYSDFFDFKGAFNQLIFDVGNVVQPWRVVTRPLEGEAFETFELRLADENTNQPISVTYVGETLLYLVGVNVSATP